MKLIVMGIAMLSTMSFANIDGDVSAKHDKKENPLCVHGKPAAKLFDHLDTEIKVKETKRATIELKSVYPLSCVKITDADAEKNRCCFKKKKRKPGHDKPSNEDK